MMGGGVGGLDEDEENEEDSREGSECFKIANFVD